MCKMFLLMLLCCCLCEGSHILVVFTIPEKSHSVLSDSLVNVLLEANYEVTYVTPYPKETRPSLTYVDISSILEQIQDKGLTNEGDLPDDTSSPRFLPLLGTRFAQKVLNHPDVEDLMMNTSVVFDAVVAEWFYTGLLAPLAVVFECPLIWYTPTDISWQSLSLVTSTPAHRLDLPPNSLAERVQNLWSQLYLAAWNYLYFSRIEIPAYEKNFRDAFKLRRKLLPNYETVVYDGSFLLLNSHPVLGPTVSLPPNVKYIGGHHISKDVPALPKNLKKVMDGSEAGVIYVNMETNLINRNTQDDIARELKEAFGELEQTVIWKYDDILGNLPHNVYTLRNPPQHSILNHANTVAFINHGGMVSITDATNYGVPVIALPLLEDQMANVNMLVKRGCGVKTDTKKLSWNLKRSVKTLLTNSSYQINAKSAKSIFRHHLASPQLEFLHWVETAVQTRGATHLRSPTLHTSVLERYNLDILLLVLMLVWFLKKVARVVRVHLDTSTDHEKDD